VREIRTPGSVGVRVANWATRLPGEKPQKKLSLRFTNSILSMGFVGNVGGTP